MFRIQIAKDEKQPYQKPSRQNLVNPRRLLFRESLLLPPVSIGGSERNILNIQNVRNKANNRFGSAHRPFPTTLLPPSPRPSSVTPRLPYASSRRFSSYFFSPGWRPSKEPAANDTFLGSYMTISNLITPNDRDGWQRTRVVRTENRVAPMVSFPLPWPR